MTGVSLYVYIGRIARVGGCPPFNVFFVLMHYKIILLEGAAKILEGVGKCSLRPPLY